MINNIIIALNAVIPIFLLIAAGFIVRLQKMFTESELNKLNGFVFKLFFPFLMFFNVYSSDISSGINPRLVIFGVCSVFVIYAFGFAVAFIFEKTRRSRGAIIQAIYRSNYVLMGIPIVTNICGAEGSGTAAVMAAIVVPIYNVLAVITLEVFRGGRAKPSKVISEILKNPLIIGAVFGILFVRFNIKLPKSVLQCVSSLSSAATPLALIVLGAKFDFSKVKSCGKNMIICTLSKLVISPAIVMSAAAILGFRGTEFVVMLIASAAPCAVSSYTMAQQMDSDAELAGGCVILTSALSVLTLFLWIVFFKHLGMF